MIGAQSEVDHSFGTLPVVFEQNQGQWNSTVRLAARGKNYGLALTDRGAMFVVGSMKKRAAFRMIVVGAGQVVPVERLEVRTIGSIVKAVAEARDFRSCEVASSLLSHVCATHMHDLPEPSGSFAHLLIVFLY
jgi:hypothetical protein